MSDAVDERAESQTAALGSYTTLLELAESGLQAALRGEVAALEDLTDRWDLLASELPQQPPASAEPLLERAAQVIDAACAQLARMQDELVREVSLAARAGRAARGYAAAGTSRALVERNV